MSSGVKKQLLYEISASKKLPEGVHWDTVVFCASSERDDQSFIHKKGHWGIAKFGRLVVFVSSCWWLLRHAKQYDVIIIRFSKLLFLLSFFKKIRSKLITLHHTKESDEEKLSLPRARIINKLIDKCITNNLSGKLYGVAGVTQEILGYESNRFNIKPPFTFTYPNGIDFNLIQVAEDRRGGVVKFIMIASEYYLWHGLELIVDRLLATSLDFEFYIIGLIRNEILLDKIAHDKRFIYGGYQESYQYAHILALCDVAIGSFGLHLKNLKQACSLKVREYLASGLPVYSGHVDFAFTSDVFPYYIVDDFDPVRLCKLALDCRKLKRQDIRDNAFLLIDKFEIMRFFLDQLADSLMGSLVEKNQVLNRIS